MSGSHKFGSFVGLLAAGFVSLLLNTSTAAASPPVYFSGTGHWYQQFTLDPPYRWDRARDLATASGGYLACIQSQDEADFLEATFVTIDGDFLGGYEPNNDGIWLWVSGEPWTFTDWCGGEPSNSSGLEDYLSFMCCTPMRCWNDVQAEVEHAAEYIVEYDSNPFCEGFEDGTGWENRWERIYGTQTLVSSPAHSGNGALRFRGSDFGCHSVLKRKSFLASGGRYTFWINHQHFEAGLSVYIEVQEDPDAHPGYRPSYVLQLHAADAQQPSSFALARNDGAGGATALLNEPALFNMNEWVQVWIERVGNVVVVGYNYNGNVVTYAAIDPSPITTPGGFYISSCSDVTPTDNFYDDICYEPFPTVPPLCVPVVIHDIDTLILGEPCLYEAGDMNSSGAVDVVDVVGIVNRAFRGSEPTQNPCNRHYEP